MKTTPPNIVLVICDDLAYGDLAVHGNPWRKPGRLDQLHDEAARLTRYCSGPMCAPARASLMTGRHYYRTGVVDTSAGRAMMHPDEITLAELAKAAGYRTGLFGKWHLGDAYPMRAIDQGFDEAITFNAGYIGQLAYPQPTGYDDPVLEHNGEWRRYQGYCTDIFTDEAIRFIHEAADSADSARPFFAYIAYNAPHTPLDVAESWVAPYRNTELPEKFAKVYGMVDNLDANLKRLLAALDEAGVAEHTIVIFTSDHGPCGGAAHEGRDRFNAGLRGRKGTVYEGGLRVPCFIRWPERIPGGRDIDSIANPIDLLPTLAAACGFAVPDERAIDGVDLTPLLYGECEAAHWPERVIFIQQDRMQDRPRRYQNYTAITQRYKLCRSRLEGADELYDLQADPYERHDLAAVMPAEVERLRAAYDAWFAAVEAERNFAPPRLGLGSPEAPVVRLTRQDWLGPGRVHMTDEEIGYWDVNVVAAGRLDVRVHLPPLAHAGTLRFALGEQVFTAPVAAGRDMQPFTIEAAAGESRVEAWVEEAGGARKGASYVEVARSGLGTAQ